MVAILLATHASVASAQGDPVFDAAGFQQNRDYFSGAPFEHVDTVTGNLILTFTDLVLPGNGGSELRFQRTFNAKNDGHSDWTFGIAGVPWRRGGYSWPPVGAETAQWPVLVMADGGLQPARATQAAFCNASNSNDCRYVVTEQFWQMDRALRLVPLSDGTTRALNEVFMPDGTITGYNNEGDLEMIRDPFGNLTTLDWDWTASDPANLTRQGLVKVTQYLGSGQSREVTIEFPPNSLKRFYPTKMTFGASEWIYQYTAAPGYLSHVTPPEDTGLGWQYGYEFGDTGDLTSVTTPYGGQIVYTWQNVEFERDISTGAEPTDPVLSHVVASRSVSGPYVTPGTWSYHYGPAPPDGKHADMTCVDAPDGSTTRFFSYPLPGGFDGGPPHWVVDKRVVEATGGGTPRETEDRDYVLVAIGAGTTSIGQTAELSLLKLTRDGREYTTTYEYRGAAVFGDFHRPYRITEAGELTRVTTRDYDYGFNQTLSGAPLILGKLLRETVEVDGQSFAKEWAYNHSNGFLVSETVYGLPPTTFAESRGNVRSSTNGNGHTTSFEYDYGLVSAIDTPEHRVTRVINPNGTVASETRAGRTTSFEYDNLLRIRTSQPPGDSNAIWTSHAPVNGRPAATVSRGNSVVTTYMDGFGRRVETVNGVGIHTYTAYDELGCREGRCVRERALCGLATPLMLPILRDERHGECSDQKDLHGGPLRIVPSYRRVAWRVEARRDESGAALAALTGGQIGGPMSYPAPWTG